MTALRDARLSKDKARIAAALEELLKLAEGPGYDLAILNEGMSMVVDLSNQPDIPPAAADRLLHAVYIRFLRAHRNNKRDEDLPTGGVLQVGGTVYGDPGALIALGQKEARAGQHDRALKLFGTALEILSFLTIEATEASDKAPVEPSPVAAVFRRDARYRKFKLLYEEMREIYRFYSVLEWEALEVRDAGRAAEAREWAAKLHGELKTRLAPFKDIDAEIAESSRIKTPTGPLSFRLHGTNDDASTDLTELPGHPFSEKLRNSKEALEPQKLELLQGSLREQAEFQAEIAREPQIRKTFGKDPVDLNDDAKRLKVWSIMYAAYKSRGPGALGALMALMGRHLKAYTYHTGYNVSDFGISYLDRKMPVDLAGRLVRDCGVYALTVAWDVFRTMKAGDPNMKLDFTLVTLPDHIMLVITDEDAGDSYFVNNERITKVSRPVHAPRPRGSNPSVCLSDQDPVTPRAKGPALDEEVGSQYLLVRDLPFLVTPASYMDLGSTSDTAGAFKAGLWQRYLASTRHMSQVKVNFLTLEEFSDSSTTLDSLLNKLREDLGKADNWPAAISAWLNMWWQDITKLLVGFTDIGSNAFKDLPPHPAGSRPGGAFRWTGSNHPLVRVALLLVFLQKQGGKLTPAQQQYLENFKRVFSDRMEKGREGAENGAF